MKSSETGTLVVGISARFEQVQREFEMTVLDRKHQRAGPLSRTFSVWFLRLHRLIHVGTRL